MKSLKFYIFLFFIVLIIGSINTLSNSSQSNCNVSLNIKYWTNIDKSHNQFLTVECEARGHPPFENITWMMQDSWNINEKVKSMKTKYWTKSSYKNFIYKIVQVKLNLTSNDKNKTFSCVICNKKKTIQIPYYKQPTKIEIIKSTPSNYSFVNGDYLKCKSVNGISNKFNISWKINEGPVNNYQYIKIHGKSKELLTINKAPGWSRWNITCYLTSMAFNVTKLFKSTISFIVKPSEISTDLDSKQYSIISFIINELKNQKQLLESKFKIQRRVNKKLTILIQKMKSYILNNFIEMTWKVSKRNVTSVNFRTCMDLAENDEIFGFQYKQNTCILYPIFEYCNPTDNDKIERIYVRLQEWKNIKSSASYQILARIKSIKIPTYLAHFILDKNKKTHSIVSVENKTVIAVSTEFGIRALASGYGGMYRDIFPLPGMKRLFNDTIYENIAGWLTKGRCVNIRSCSFELLDRSKYWKSTGVIVILNSYLHSIDNRVYKKIESGDWGVMFIGWTYNKKYIKMAKKYGFTVDSYSFSTKEVQFSPFNC